MNADRSNMQIQTLDYNTAPGVEIPLDDVDEERYINIYIHTEEGR